MRDSQMRESVNVQDRRGLGPRTAIGGVGGLVFVLIIVLLGGNPAQFLGQSGVQSGSTVSSPEQERQVEFVKRVLGDTEDVWGKLMSERGETYPEPVLVIFSGATESACGQGTAASGPFYCPLDSKVYIDLSFYDELAARFGAAGDFAQAYVIAHEVGHHIQTLTGDPQRVQNARGRVSEAEYNALSVRLELQADFYAGVWAHHARNRGLLEAGDVEEALRCAAAIGDDRLMKQAGRSVQPESFTHGTSTQRVRWFRKGLETGDLSQGDTFNANPL